MPFSDPNNNPANIKVTYSTVDYRMTMEEYEAQVEADLLQIITETIITETITQIEVNHHEDCAIETDLDGQRAIHTYRAEYLVEPIAKAVLDALKNAGVVTL